MWVEKGCTWYYGAPTMHLLVINSVLDMPGGAPETKIRFVANAAGPLLPSVGIQLRKAFPGAAVLTSYGRESYGSLMGALWEPCDTLVFHFLSFHLKPTLCTCLYYYVPLPGSTQGIPL